MRVKYWKQDLGLIRPYKIAGQLTTSSENAFFQIELAAGTIGIGAGSPSIRVCNEDMSDTLNGLEKAAECLEGRDISMFGTICDELGTLLRDTPAAATAVNTALYDGYAKKHDMRIVDMLGIRCDPLPTSVTIGIKDEDGVRSDLDEYLSKGFSIVKVKIGDDPERDVHIIRKIREWGGSGLRIRVDANQGYDLEQLIATHAELKKANVEFVEQPLMAPANEQLKALNEHIRTGIMADEDLKTVGHALELSRTPRGYGSWNIKLMKSGGIGPAKLIGDIAGWNGIPLMWGCMDESRVSIAAALHTAYSCASTRYLDLDGSFDLASDVVNGGFEVRDGYMYLTEHPGLGVELIDP